MFGPAIILSSLLLASPIVARPTANPLGTSLLLNRQGQVTGIGPIAPGCETPCNPLVSVFANSSVQDPTVTCASNVVNQVAACASCELGVLGFDQSSIEAGLSNFKDECAAAGFPVSLTVSASGPVATTGSSTGSQSAGSNGSSGNTPAGGNAGGAKTSNAPTSTNSGDASSPSSTDGPKKNSSRRLATSGGMLGALIVGMALVIL
ncbi:hypothetical protein MVEN_01755000 [Mycena venus]|uniref:Uncharacterized protein n=1 Tax=Mycena venus TaxID=2733690 RepID=A0A8H6XMQ8_9AGAR|nr:hypothetical protein MVEN_01755000 [Mycena venus]